MTESYESSSSWNLSSIVVINAREPTQTTGETLENLQQLIHYSFIPYLFWLGKATQYF